VPARPPRIRQANRLVDLRALTGTGMHGLAIRGSSAALEYGHEKEPADGVL